MRVLPNLAGSLIQLVSGSAADLRVRRSWIDMNATTFAVAGVSAGAELAAINTAATTTIVASPGTTNVRNVTEIAVRNAHASVSTSVVLQTTDGTNTNSFYACTLAPGEHFIMGEDGQVLLYTSAGVIKDNADFTVFGHSTASQSATFATDIYVTGSFVVFPAAPKVGTRYRCIVAMTKSAAGTAASISQVRIGTAGTTADTSRSGNMTLSAGTAATDWGLWQFDVLFRSVGSGTSAVVACSLTLISQPTTGFSSLLKGFQVVSAGFDSTVAGLGIGVSINGGASASWTAQQVQAEITNAV